MTVYDSVKEWLLADANDRLFVYWRKGSATRAPSYCKIEKAVHLSPEVGWLLGIREYYEGVYPSSEIEYLRLCDITLAEEPEAQEGDELWDDQ